MPSRHKSKKEKVTKKIALLSGFSACSFFLFPFSFFLLPGCSESQKRQWRTRSPSENYTNALEAEHGDVRRDATTRIAESGYRTSEDAFHVLDAVARTDPVSQVRCIAIRAFAHYDDDRPVPGLLAMLQAGPNPNQALPADDDVRWEASRSLLVLMRKDVLSDVQREQARDVFIRLLETDASRQVRLVAAEALGEFSDRRVLRPLIELLRSNDYGMANRGERSLIRLTGVTHEYDPDEWEAWLAATDDPFAQAGENPVADRPSGPSWFDRQIRAFRRGLNLPGPK